jgi:hypothetical protein
VTIEIERIALRRGDVTVPSVEEEQADRRRAAIRGEVRLKVTALTLAWAVSVAMLLGWSLANKGPNDGSNAAAALVGMVLPFVCAVLGTRHRMPALGGTYVVITLLMVLPAIWLLQS